MRIKGVTSSISIKYARALFDVAISNGGKEKLEKIINDFEIVNQILGQGKDSIFEFLSSPLINIDQKLTIIKKLSEYDMNEFLYNLLVLLVKRSRLKSIKDIHSLLTVMRDELNDVVRSEIYVSSAIDDNAKNNIVNRLGKIVGRSVKAEFVEDKTVLAGFVTYLSSYYIDYSLSSQLDKLETELKRG